MTSWKELQFLDPREHKALQNRLLRRYVEERLYPFSAYYRELFDRHKIQPDRIRRVEDLADLPFTTKDDLVARKEDPDRPRRFILAPTLEMIREHWPLRRKAGLLLKGAVCGKSSVRRALRREFYPIFMTFTTGRSALPVPFLFAQHDLDNLAEAGRRLTQVLGFTEDQRGLNLFPYAPHLAFWQVAFGGFAGGSMVLHTGGGKVAGTEGNLRALERMQPQNVIGVPGYLYHLMREAAKRGVKAKGVRTIVLGADAVPPGLKQKLALLLEELGSPGVHVLGTYGFTEARMAFGECPTSDGSSSGYHIFPDMGIFEIVDPDSGEVLPLEADGELVYTPLTGRGTSVLRYRTGDLVEGGIRTGACPHCGRTLPRISSRLSRVSSMQNVALKKVKGTLVNIEELGRVIADDLDIEEWQIELRKKDGDPLEVDELVLYLATKPGADQAAVEHRLRQRIKTSTEISPNEICFLAIDSLLERVGMEKEMKEKRFVDARSAS